MQLPSMAPAIMSEGKCTPKIMREQLTLIAQSIIGNATRPNSIRVKFANKKAAMVCPEGKLNLSDAVTILEKSGTTSGGLFLRRLFFKMKYKHRSKAKLFKIREAKGKPNSGIIKQ